MQTNSIDDLTIIRYKRKSTEDEEKQIASLDDQETELNILNRHLKIPSERMYGSIAEAKSAKLGGTRPGFLNEVIAPIQQGHANAIQAWHPDRITRNTTDTDLVVRLMDSGKLRAIITPQRIFWNTPMDKFFFGFMCLQAKLDNDNKSINVIRGLSSKVKQGWRPGIAPIGYLNDKTKLRGERDIVIDPERFGKVRKLFDLALTGRYSHRELRDIAEHKLMLTSPPRRKSGGKPLGKSYIGRILMEPFYYGYFWWTNPETDKRELCKGKHKPMISEEEFQKIRMVYGREIQPRAKAHLFPYTGLIRCGECKRSTITAEEKWQVICGNCSYKFASQNRNTCPRCEACTTDTPPKKILHYVYYHCTKKADPTCSQRSIRVEELEREIDAVLARFAIKEKYMKWAITTLAARRERQTEKRMRREKRLKLQNLRDQVRELNRFIVKQEVRGWTLMSKEDALSERTVLTQEIAHLEAVHGESGDDVNSLSSNIEYACHARYWLRQGSNEQKRRILEGLGSNLRLLDKKLNVCLENRFLEIEKLTLRAPRIKARLEPKNMA